MTVVGETGSTVLRSSGRSSAAYDAKSLMTLSSPKGLFGSIVGEKGSSTINFSVLKYPDSVYGDEFVAIPVFVRSSGRDLRGKTVEIVTTRDFRSSIAPDLVEKLNEKWKDYGTVWTGVAESDTLTLHIPQDPLTRNCQTPSPSK